MENLPNFIFQSMDDFIISQDSKPLGSGSFGVVKKAMHKATGKIYAIKIIKLDESMNQPQMLLLTRQISIHYQLNHPHIIKLWAVLEQNDKIYMIMDYAQNGNLFHYFNHKKTLTQAQSYKIFYQVLDAIQYMHKIDVFHRDIKPENILLDHQFNVKLCDFGWVADQINRKRNTFCGTYQYMAPQMIKDIPYNYKIDIWALGVLLYELNHGKAPFPADSIETIKLRFQKGVYQIKQTLSQQFKILVVGILQFDPSKRIQIEDIKNSQWVKKNRFSTFYSSKNQVNRNQSVNKNQILHHCHSAIKLIPKQQKSTEQRQKKHHKKYRTLQQQDLYYINHNLLSSKIIIGKDNQKYLHSTKQGTTKQKSYKQSHKKLGFQQNLKSTIKQAMINSHSKQATNTSEKKQEIRKKKLGSTRIHTRTGTQSSQMLNKKLSKVVFQQKLKMFNDERKKKIANKKC